MHERFFNNMGNFPLPVSRNVMLKHFSTFRIGGPASYLTKISSLQDAKNVFSFIHKNSIPFIVIGYGSNCLFDDQGFQGLVILNRMKNLIYNPDNHNLTVDGGFSFSSLGRYCAQEGLQGLEFADGIPGTVGGAIFMNAGCGKNDTASKLESVSFIDQSGELITAPIKDLKFDYRLSPFQSNRTQFITSGVFKVTPSSDVRHIASLFKKKRSLTQPYQEKSAGCIFRNPPGLRSAGKLIDLSGCKGLQEGSAAVSNIHANFIINKGQARCRDVLKLIDSIKTIVFNKTGITLQEEVQIIPFSKKIINQ